MTVVVAALALAASPAAAANSYTVSDDASCNAFVAAIGGTGGPVGPGGKQCVIRDGTLPAGDSVTFADGYALRPQGETTGALAVDFTNNGTVTIASGTGDGLYLAGHLVNNGTFNLNRAGISFSGSLVNHGTFNITAEFVFSGIIEAVSGTLSCTGGGSFTFFDSLSLSGNTDLPPSCLRPSTITASGTKANNTPYTEGTWTNQTVTVHFTCVIGSFPSPEPCPADQVFASEGKFTATGSIREPFRGPVTATFAVWIDKTPPVITVTATKADGTPYTYDTWTNQIVTVHFTCTDGTGSGLAFSCPGDEVLTEGISQGALSGTDQAGNGSGAVAWGPVKIDQTKPTITASATNADGSAYTSGTVTTQTVTVHYTCADERGGSGVASCPDDDVISDEGTTTLGRVISDNAGNSATVTFVVEIRRTPPTVSCGVADGLWHATDVSIPCTASDTASGLANPADASFNLTTSVPAGTETANAATGTRTVANKAGLSTVAGPITGNKVDRKAPSIVVTTPTANAFYLLNQAVTAGYSCSDGGSGVATCAGPVASGAGLNTATVGAKAFTVNATDQVGNASTATVNYQVGYAFTGFGRPVGNPPTVNTGRAGQDIPLKWKLADANGTPVTALTTFRSVTYQKTACPGATGAPGPVTTAVSEENKGVKFDDGQFKFEWVTPRTAGCYTVTLTLDSGQTFQALFNLKR